MTEYDVIGNLKEVFELLDDVADRIMVYPDCDNAWEKLCLAQRVLNKCIKELEKGGRGER